MGPNPHSSHSFGGMFELLVKRRENVPFFFTASLCQPLAMVWRYVFGVASLQMLCSLDFWRWLLRLIAWFPALWLAWRYTRRWLVVLYIWKVFAYLPVLPLSDTWAWYEFMPHVLDPILPVSVAWALWRPLDLPGRAGQWWRERKSEADT